MGNEQRTPEAYVVVVHTIDDGLNMRSRRFTSTHLETAEKHAEWLKHQEPATGRTVMGAMLITLGDEVERLRAENANRDRMLSEQVAESNRRLIESNTNAAMAAKADAHVRELEAERAELRAQVEETAKAAGVERDQVERLSAANAELCEQASDYEKVCESLGCSGSMEGVGMVYPDVDTVCEAIRDIARRAAEGDELRIACHIDDWHEDIGNVLWWKFPVTEPPYCGTPLDADFPDYVTSWSRIPEPFGAAGDDE